MKEKIYKIEKEKLRIFLNNLFIRLNIPSDNAKILIDTLIKADLRGLHSHGVIKVPIYVKRFQMGLVNCDCTFKTIKETASTALIDGCNGIGQVIAYKAMNIAIKKALDSGISCVGVKNSNHFGAAAYFSSMALEKDMVGISTTNGVAVMAPTGGTKKLVCNNPISVAIPADKELPIILDLAFSVVAQGKIVLAKEKGEKIPFDWGTDKFGKKTDDPSKVLDGGMMLPIGGYKGYGLALIADVLTGILTGSLYSAEITSLFDLKNPNICSHLFLAINIQNFVNIKEFKTRVDDLIKTMKSCPKGEGVNRIYVPGEIEYENEEKSMREGIELPKEIVNELEKLAKNLNVDFLLT